MAFFPRSLLQPLRDRPSGRTKVLWFVALVLMVGVSRGFGADSPLEYRVKAGFLFNFAKFVEWPAASLPADAPLRIGVLAPPDVYAAIEETLAGKSIAGHAIVLVKVTLDRPLDPTLHLLFVHRSFDLSADQLTALVGEHPVLVVGDAPGFASTGGMIGFVRRGDTLRFQVNLAAAAHANLQLSGKLASIAEIVRSK